MEQGHAVGPPGDGDEPAIPEMRVTGSRDVDGIHERSDRGKRWGHVDISASSGQAVTANRCRGIGTEDRKGRKGGGGVRISAVGK